MLDAGRGDYLVRETEHVPAAPPGSVRLLRVMANPHAEQLAERLRSC